MKKPTAHEALVYLMVVTSASDRDMTDVELARIGDVVKSWPIFQDFNSDSLVKVAQDCQKLLHEDGGLQKVIATARDAVPLHLHDTAYAAAFEVAAVDLEMRMEELRAATPAPRACGRPAHRRGDRARQQGASSQPHLKGAANHAAD